MDDRLIEEELAFLEAWADHEDPESGQRNPYGPEDRFRIREGVRKLTLECREYRAIDFEE